MELEQIKRLFPKMDYTRGMSYFKEGRVRKMACCLENDRQIVKACVQGSKLYEVRFDAEAENLSRAFCTCPRFDEMGFCKHLAAAMVAYVRNPPPNATSKSDQYAKDLLESYLKKIRTQSDVPQTPARVVPRLTVADRYDYPSFSLRVGYEKLYAVKNIQEFLENVEHERTVPYGKGLTLNHSIGQFDLQSQKIIQLLMNEFPEFKSIHRRYSYYYSNNPYGYKKNEITLSGDSFDRWFDLLSGAPLESGRNCLELAVRDPQVSIVISEQNNAACLNIRTSQNYTFFGSPRSFYAISPSELLRCSETFRENVYPLLRSEQEQMQLSREDLPTFCSCVLPIIRDLVQIEDPGEILQDYLPDECTVQFYFDLEEDTLLLRLAFVYGTHSFRLLQEEQEAGDVRRNKRQETSAAAFAGHYCQRQGELFLLSGEEAVFEFLCDTLDSFREQGEVYLSDRLKNKQLRPAAASIGISVSDGLLSLQLDTGGFPPEELSALYESMLLRRKYHRLSDGRFLALDGSSCEKIAEITQMLQLSPKKLAGGVVTLPAYRGLYLDAVLAGSEEIQVKRDSQFRAMVRNFKTLSESDYALPDNLNNTLRTYQRTGFQWLKTLAGYGFGGILADEMGLGKTLQVIAFLATVTRKEVGAANLVVCPASLIYNWGDEMQKFAPQLHYCLILGNAAQRKSLRSNAQEADVWVTSYELLCQDLHDYTQQNFYCCILDEAQHIKNAATLASKAAKSIPCRQRFALTGTPIENRLSELWNLFDFLMPGYLYTKNTFREKLEKPIVKSKNPEALSQLRRLIQPFLLRRLKADVLKELPPKQEYVRRISLSEDEQKLYYANVQAAVTELGAGQGKLQILAALTRLRQLCCDPNLCFENYTGPTSKLDACVELCEAMVENGHQILLFSQFTSMLEHLRSRLDAKHISNFTLQGSTSKEQRASLVKSFNAGGASVFLISLKAGGTGLNLTAADVVIHFDPWWNQAVQNQATDRAHRIGQRSRVQVYKLIAKDTIEEKILELQEKKAALLDTVSGCKDGGIMNMSSEELLDLLKI